MTLDEVIAHEKRLAEENYLQGMLCHANPDDEELDGCIERGKYHEWVAKWLENYKRLSSATEQDIYERAYKDGYDKGYFDGNFFGYNKAIDAIEEMIEDTDWYHIHNGNLVHGANSDIHEPLYKYSDIKSMFKK